MNVSSPSSQITTSVAKTSRLAGVEGKLLAHDVGRGSAVDIARLESSSSSGTATEAVAAGIGHLQTDLHKGATTRYVGGSNNDLWEKRV